MKKCPSEITNLEVSYRRFKQHARFLGVEWGFTPETWEVFWQGKSGSVGFKKADYTVVLDNPRGPYSPENAQIEILVPKCRDNRFTGRGKGRAVIDPDGRVYNTIAEAAQAHERHRETISYWCRKNLNGWRLKDSESV